uniref:Uncharacterized protein n=1 Tax=Alexandrium monilatum TaxID=311494 RepID=A0A7S4PZS3_9DINO
MRPKDPRRSKSASALQSAAAMTLKGDSPAMKLPALKAGSGRVSTWSRPAARVTAAEKDGMPVQGKLDQLEQLEQLQRASEEPRTAKLHKRPMSPVFEEDLEEGQIHDLPVAEEEEDGEGNDAQDEEQLRHLEEVESELEAELQAALSELAGYMQTAKVDELHGDLRIRMAQLAPRMKTLDERGKNLRRGVRRR